LDGVGKAHGVSSMAWEPTEIPHTCGEMLVLFTSPKRFYKCRTCDVIVHVGSLEKFIDLDKQKSPPCDLPKDGKGQPETAKNGGE